MLEDIKVNTIIIEDQIEARDYVTSILKNNFDRLSILGYADTITDAVALINKQKPELIFMDIELKDGHSFEIFKSLTYHDFEVIFITAFEGFIQKALDHYALNYLIKPVDKEKLIATVNRYIAKKDRLYNNQKYELLSEFLNIKNSRLMVNTGNQYISVKIDEIIKCVADGNYTHFHLANGNSLFVSKSLKYYESLLLSKGFFKPNRSVIININFIESIYKKETIILQNKDKINVSQRNKSNLIGLINSLS